MARGRKAKTEAEKPVSNRGAKLGFETKLWAAADKLHNNTDG